MKSAKNIFQRSEAPLNVAVLVLDDCNTLSFAAGVDPMRAANRLGPGRPFDWSYVTATEQPARLTSGLAVPGTPIARLEGCDLMLVIAGFNLDRHGTPALLASLRRLAALLPADAGIADQVASRLRLSTRQRKHLSAISAYRHDARPVRQLAHAIGIEAARDARLLGGNESDAAAAVAALDGWTVPQLPVRGGDIVARGIAAGPEVARILQGVEAQWVAEDYPDAARVAELVDQMIGRSSD